jgi:hypothetical protein
MAKLLARNNRLKSRNGRLVRNDPGCKAACCGGGAECCQAPTVDGGSPNTCGRTSATHIACVTYLRQTWEQNVTETQNNTTTERFSSTGPVFRTTNVNSVYHERQTESKVLNGPNSGTGGCTVGWLAPVTTETLFEWDINRTTTVNESGQPTQTTTLIDGAGSGSAFEDCVSATMGCPPIGDHTQQDGEDLGYIPIVQDTFTNWGTLEDGRARPRFTDTTTTDNAPRPGCTSFSQVVRETVTRSLKWNGSHTGLRMVYREERTIDTTLNSTCAIPAGFGTQQISTRRIATSVRESEVTARIGWDTDCDGVGGPATCTPVATVCQPNLIKYIIGVPCGPAPGRPVVLPAFLVETCGYANIGGTCYQFSPAGLSTTNPFGMNAVIGSARVDTSSPQSCCECNPACNKTDLANDSRRTGAWLNGQRDGVTGAWTTSPAFTAGGCCCNPDDLFRVRTGYTTRQVKENGAQTFLERLDMTQLTGSTFPTPVSGMRRDFAIAEYSQRYTDTTGANFPNFGAYQIIGPVGCEYGGFGTSGGTTVWNLDKPLDWDGNHIRANGLPSPVEANANGEGNGWRLMRYALSATCSSLTCDAEWQQVSGSTVYTIEGHLVLDVIKDTQTSGPCTGGCATLPAVPPASPVPPGGPISGVPDLRSILGGV